MTFADILNLVSWPGALPIVVRLETENPNRPQFVDCTVGEYALAVAPDGRLRLSFPDEDRSTPVWHGLVIELKRAPS
jgi:hypothetical protein